MPFKVGYPAIGYAISTLLISTVGNLRAWYLVRSSRKIVVAGPANLLLRTSKTSLWAPALLTTCSVYGGLYGWSNKSMPLLLLSAFVLAGTFFMACMMAIAFVRLENEKLYHNDGFSTQVYWLPEISEVTVGSFGIRVRLFSEKSFLISAGFESCPLLIAHLNYWAKRNRNR